MTFDFQQHRGEIRGSTPAPPNGPVKLSEMLRCNLRLENMKDKSDGESDKNVRYKNKIVEIYGNLK